MPNATDELKKILSAINNRDREKFFAHVDLKTLMDIGYDEATDILADNCSKFHELYPKDLFFKFGSRILRIYNDKFRGVHLGLINKIIESYFDGSFKDAKNFSSTPIKFLAVKMVSDNSSYGHMIGVLKFVLEFDRQDDNWRLFKIKNAEELVPPILDIAERYWPESWDLGIKF